MTIKLTDICFCIREEEIASWDEDIKYTLKRFTNAEYWGLSDLRVSSGTNMTLI